jgi:hypothetical protein
MRLFFFVDGDQVAAFEADVVPRVDDAVWVKTVDYEDTLIVKAIEHEFDRSTVERYKTHDVSLTCIVKKK